MAKKWGRRPHCLFLMADLDSTSVNGSVSYPVYFYISLFEVRNCSFSVLQIRLDHLDLSKPQGKKIQAPYFSLGIFFYKTIHLK